MEGERFGPRKPSVEKVAMAVAIPCEDPLTSIGIKTCLERKTAWRVEEWRIHLLLEADPARVPKILIMELSVLGPHRSAVDGALVHLAQKSKLIVLWH